MTVRWFCVCLSLFVSCRKKWSFEGLDNFLDTRDDAKTYPKLPKYFWISNCSSTCSSFMIIEYDHHTWSSYMIVIYDHHIWSLYTMKNSKNRSDLEFFSKVFGDLWDMFWHHHWCLIHYLDNLTVIFSKKVNRSNKLQNHALFRYSNTSLIWNWIMHFSIFPGIEFFISSGA